MAIISVTKENIGTEHICCAISEKKGETCVADKKAWLSARFDDGLVFKKLDVRGKVFIEYIPAEKAWYPINAPGYMHIDCLWVSGQYKGKGYAGELLGACVEDAKVQGKHGVTCLSSVKKMPFLADGKFLKHKGFRVADTAEPFYELLYLPFEEDAPTPTFWPQAKTGTIAEKGLALYYSNQCPYTNTYAKRIQAVAEKHGRTLALHQLTSAEEAQQSPAPFATYTLYEDGIFVTNEILSEGKFERFLKSNPS